MRKKLVSLIREITPYWAEAIADYLLKHGWINPVRCKDCKHFGGHGACHCHAADENGTPIFVRENDFCSYGERRADD